MAWLNSLRKRDDCLLYQERAIFYHNPIPGWLRLLVGLVGGLTPLLPLGYFLSHWLQIDWSNPPALLFLGIHTLFLCLLPSAIIILSLWFAGLAMSIELRINAVTNEVVLTRSSGISWQITCYPLDQVEITKVGLPAQNPDYEHFLTLQMPGGLKVDICSFMWDHEAKECAGRINQFILEARTSTLK
ncbi:hypothetical protein [Shewanella mangrovisoli]|uniref:hypothetical protein n=1 Tax=Shewanella mangrovisoli TaxID=2864211 RepID=UPI001C65BD14|nr:hypothetical protein [Shewanella mangrovisoli]QYK09260.1 hypothetical protein K0H60_00690 [Shewanella mangrovisoli]